MREGRQGWGDASEGDTVAGRHHSPLRDALPRLGKEEGQGTSHPP